jgi:hypothetical protein
MGLESVTAHADPTKDQCIDSNESAQTLRAAGKLREAMSKLTVCVARSCPALVRDDCAERLNTLQKLLPTVVFEVRSASGTDVTAVRVTMDGAPLTAKLDGTSLAVDPGQHTFRFEAEGFAPFDEPLLIREGDKARRERVALRGGPGTSPPASAGAQTAEASASRMSTPRVVAFAALGVGVVGVAVGSIFGAMAIADKSSLSDNCNGKTSACPSSQQSDISGFHSNGTTSDVAFGVGIAGLAAGAVLFFVSRSHESTEGGAMAPVVSFGLGLGRASLRGTF